VATKNFMGGVGSFAKLLRHKIFTGSFDYQLSLVKTIETNSS